MAKPGTKLTEASANLIELNTKLHEIMADIINQKQEKEGIAVIPHSLVSEAYQAGTKASKILANNKPDAPQLANIEILTEAVGKVMEVIPAVEGKLTMTSEAATELNTVILNNLANQVHDAGMSLIGITKQLQACSVSELEPTEAAAVNKYCSGVLPNITHEVVVTKVPLQYTTVKGKKEILTYPSHISHKLGVHRVELSTASTDGDTKTAIQYKESGPQYHDMPGRQKGVHDRLVQEGFTCNVGKGENIPFGKDLAMYCWGTVDKEKLRRLATFFSLLLNADIGGMGTDTAPVVSEKVWDIAGKLNEQYLDKTWQSGQGMLSWPTVQKQWKDEKVIYEKTIIYKDLRDLAILRDKIHEMEFAIESDKATKQTYQTVIKRAYEAVAILKKNNWPYHTLLSAVGSLKAAVDAGQLKLAGLSDQVWHNLHVIIANLLTKEGSYGGCSTKGDIENVNAGNLAYCEGVLKGTSAQLSKSGNLATHKITPLTYHTFILDENPDGSYDITINIPSGEGWNNQLRKHLKENWKFSCTSSQCKANIKSLEDIRRLALLLSNLRGASEAIGDECAEKAIQLAHNASLDQNKKDVFAFTQEPIMPNAKAWIDMCHKTYGILPPGLTEEEKKLLELLGPAKVYAGCSFAETDIIPNKGILLYCEGVRKNPQAEVNARLDQKGELEHYYHDKLDQIATVNIIPLGEDRYQVELNNIHMMGDYLQAEVIKRLKEWGYTCPTNSSCSAERSGSDIRRAAAFLSSLHQIYKFNTKGETETAVKYVIEKLYELPEDETIHDHMVYPWTYEDWLKVLAGVKPPEEKPPPAKPKEIVPPAEWKPYKPIPKPPFKVYGCTSLTKATPTFVKQKYCSGVIGTALVAGEEKPFKLPGMLSNTAATLGTKENKHYVGGCAVIFDSKWKTLFITLPPDLAKVKPLVNMLQQKFDMKTKDGITFLINLAYYGWAADKIATFLSHCSGIDMLPEWCQEAAVKYALQKGLQKGLQPIYPYAQLDWLNEICAKVPGAPVVKPKPKPGQLEKAILEFLKPKSPAEWYFGAQIEEWLHKNYDITTEQVAEALAKLHNEGKIMYVTGKGYRLVEKPKPIVSFDQLKSVLLKEIEKYPGLPFSPTEMLEMMVDAGWEPKTLGDVNTALGSLVSEGELESPEINTYVYKWVEKPELTPDEVKSEVLWYFQKVKAGEKAKYEDLVSHILTAYPEIESGPADKAGTIAWAVYELMIEKKIAFYGGTTYGLPEKPPMLLDYSQLSQDTVDEIADYICSAKEKGYSSLYIYDQVPKIFLLKTIPEMAKLIYDQYTACPEKILKAVPVKPKPTIDELIEKSKAKVPQLYSKLTPSDKKKMQETLEYKKLPKAVKDWLHALMNLQLLEDHKSGIPYEDSVKTLQHKIIEVATPIPITPLMVKLQTDIERKSKIRRGELPAEPGEKVSYIYEELPDWEKSQAYDLIKELAEEGKTEEEIKAKIAESYGIKESFGLNQIISGEVLIAKPKPTFIEDLPDEDQEKIIKLIESSYALGITADMVTKAILKEYPTLFEGTLFDYVVKKYGELAVKPPVWTTEKIKIHILEYAKKAGEFTAGDITYPYPGPPFEDTIAAADALVEEGKLEATAMGYLFKLPKKLKFPADLTEKEKGKVEDWIKANCPTMSEMECIDAVSEQFGIMPVDELTQWVVEIMQEMELVYLHYSEMPKEKQLEITKYILEGVQAGKFADEIKGILELAYPELEWDEEIETIVKALIAEWEAEVGKEITEMPKLIKVIGIEVPEAFVEATKKTITDGYEAGLSLPNIVQNAYSPTWQAVKPNVFKEWVKEVIEEYKKAEEKPKYYSDLPHKEQLKVTADIKKAKEKGTTKAELIQYLLEAYGIFTDTPLSDFIDAIYQAKPTELYYEELKSFILKEFQDHPGINLTTANLVTAVINQGYTEPSIKIINEVIDVLVGQGWIEQTSVKFPYAWQLQKMPPVPAIVEAIKIIKEGKPYAGCHPQVPNVELNEPLAVYCQGILTLPWKHEAGFVRTATDEDIALLEAAAILASKKTPIVEHHGDGYRVTLTRAYPSDINLVFQDAEKEGPHWKERQKAVLDTLENKLKLECSAAKETFSCSRKVSSPMTSHETRELRRTAAFLSSLHDIDSLESNCINQAVDYAYQSAILLEKGNKSLWKSMPYPYTVKEWKKKVCS